MKTHLNTLFVTTPGAYLAKEGQNVLVRIDSKPRLRVPLHNLGGIVCLGAIGCSPGAMGLCAEAGVPISFLSRSGRFVARVSGFTSGNVLLRREQYRQADHPDQAAAVARHVVIGKVANSRSVLLRALRTSAEGPSTGPLQRAADRLGQTLDDLDSAADLDAIRGLEGEAGRAYFGAFDHLITAEVPEFRFTTRSRRPPRDPVNAVLSFLYAMLAHDVRSACEAAGLDPAVGFLHRDRPGRPGLALDLMEEFRAFLADRTALALINRRQLSPGGFTANGPGVRMDDATRKAVITTYQKAKDRSIQHPYLNEKTTLGLLPHIQARLLSRYLRGELDAYPPFLWK